MLKSFSSLPRCAPQYQQKDILPEKNSLRVVGSSGLGIAFLLRCCDLLYFIKNKCELGIKCCAFCGGFMLCTPQLFCPISTGDSVLTSSGSRRICWHIQWTIPSLWPPFHRGSWAHLCYCYMFCFDLPHWVASFTFIELLIFSILPSERKVHASYFKRFSI